MGIYFARLFLPSFTFWKEQLMEMVNGLSSIKMDAFMVLLNREHCAFSP